MTVEELPEHLKAHWPSIREKLEAGTYQPSPVKRVEIPKPNGGVRLLGIPTVQDRLIQQAMHQVLSREYRTNASVNTATGFDQSEVPMMRWKPHKGTSMRGYKWVVDIDMAKFFDTVNHDRLMARMKATNQRQAGTETGQCVSESRGDGQRGGDGDGGRDTARWTAVAVAVKHRVGRTRPRTGKTRTSLCALCGRLQHLCEKRAAAERVLASTQKYIEKTTAPESQRGEKRSGLGNKAQVPGLQLLLKSRRGRNPHRPPESGAHETQDEADDATQPGTVAGRNSRPD